MTVEYKRHITGLNNRRTFHVRFIQELNSRPIPEGDDLSVVTRRDWYKIELLYEHEPNSAVK